MVHHRVDRPVRQRPRGKRFLHVDQKDRQPLGTARRGLARRRAREQDHQVAMFSAAGPQLLAVDDIFVAPCPGPRSGVLLRDGLQAQRIGATRRLGDAEGRSEEHTSELQSLMRISYAVFCLTKKKITHSLYISTIIHYS